VIEAGLRNIRRLTAQGANDGVVVELDHLDTVTALLTRYLLYGGSGRRFDETEHFDYWQRIRPAYIEKADPASVDEMEVAWGFVGHMIEALEYHRSKKSP
jgi:hypothetical protein